MSGDGAERAAPGPLLADALVTGVERRVATAAVVALSLACTALILHASWFGSMTALLLRALFFSLVGAVGLIVVASRRPAPPARAALYLLALATLGGGPYLHVEYLSIIRGGGIADGTDVAMFVVTMLAVLVLARAWIGWTMVALAGVALAYALFGDLVPGTYGHGGYSVSRLTSNLFLRTEGLYGLPMGVAAQYIFLFSLLGTLLMRSGLGQVFVDLAQALTGRMQGGPALTAVVSSTLFSSINGSAVAGVVITGTFTIPLMKRAGYRPKVAGAIEAAASSAGQIMPPVMGAAAFLMAEMTQLPYATIALAALVPALLYVFALLVAVRLEAGKFDMARGEAATLPTVREVLLGRGYMLAPLVVLVAALAGGYTPVKAAVFAIGGALALMPWSARTRVGPRELVRVTVDTLVIVMPVVAAVAVAGVLIGVLTLTGLALQISSMILALGGDSLPLVLLLTMLASFVLGLGMPTSAAYLLLAILVAPALVRFGVPLIAAHLFIFYYGLLSAITPPVALAAYAGASIAGAGPNETAVEAMRLGFVKVIAPFLFVYSPGLLLIGDAASVATDTLCAFGAVFALGTAMTGWFVRDLSALERGSLTLGAVLLVIPVGDGSTAAAVLLTRLAAAALVGTVIAVTGRARRPS